MPSAPSSGTASCVPSSAVASSSSSDMFSFLLLRRGHELSSVVPRYGPAWSVVKAIGRAHGAPPRNPSAWGLEGAGSFSAPRPHLPRGRRRGNSWAWFCFHIFTRHITLPVAPHAIFNGPPPLCSAPARLSLRGERLRSALARAPPRRSRSRRPPCLLPVRTPVPFGPEASLQNETPDAAGPARSSAGKDPLSRARASHLKPESHPDTPPRMPR